MATADFFCIASRWQTKLDSINQQDVILFECGAGELYGNVHAFGMTHRWLAFNLTKGVRQVNFNAEGRFEGVLKFHAW